jgi:hypothetical protein
VGYADGLNQGSTPAAEYRAGHYAPIWANFNGPYAGGREGLPGIWWGRSRVAGDQVTDSVDAREHAALAKTIPYEILREFQAGSEGSVVWFCRSTRFDDGNRTSPFNRWMLNLNPAL